MPSPKYKDDVKRFLGFVTYLAKLIANLSELNALLRELPKIIAMFICQPAQEEAFPKLKEQCYSQPVLKYFDVNKPVKIQTQASMASVRYSFKTASLLPIGHVPSPTAKDLTHKLKKKCWPSYMQKVSSLHIRQRVIVHNDHKTLEQILQKPLLAAPMWLQRMILHLQWYDRKDKEMYLLDVLSRAYLPDTSNPEITDLE